MTRTEWRQAWAEHRSNDHYIVDTELLYAEGCQCNKPLRADRTPAIVKYYEDSDVA
jgi:hypothetical protein